jgi:L-asparagine transporter-like permease
VGVLAAIASMFNLGDIITGLMVARILIQFVGHTIGLFVLRKTQPQVKLPFKMWLYPAPAILALIGWIYVFASPAFEPGGWKFMAYAFTTICVGIVGYFILASKKRIWPMAAGNRG